MNLENKKRHDKRGFTLAELLVVVAIIAVLVAVAIPVFTAATDKAEEAVCMANRRSWYGMLVTDNLMNGPNTGAFVIGTVGYASDKDEYKQFVCPSGGTLSYNVKSDGSIEMCCSEHQAIQYNAGTVLSARVNAVMEQLKKKNFAAGKRIDSNAQGASLEGWYRIVKEGLPESFNNNAPTWAVLNNSSTGMQYVWSSESITMDDINTQVPVLCYNQKSGTYSVGYSDVIQSKDGTYPIIAGDSSFSPVGVTGSGYTGLEYEQAVVKYNTLLEEYTETKTKP